MKKMTLLFTILCAGQLYGMEPEQGLGAFGDLPPELHGAIVKSLATSKNLEQTIEAIKVASALQGVRYDNVKDFTKLVNILADKFDTKPISIARKFNMPASEEYIKNYYTLGNALINAIGRWEDKSEIIRLIEEGADVNIIGGSALTPLIMAKSKGREDIVKLLLDYGAKD